MQPLKSKDNFTKSMIDLSGSPCQLDESSSSKEELPKIQARQPKKTKRDELLGLSALKEPEATKKANPCASYVAEKLERFSPRNRRNRG